MRKQSIESLKVITVVMLLAGSICGCGSSSSKYADSGYAAKSYMAEEAAYEELDYYDDAAEEVGSSLNSTTAQEVQENAATANRKLIRTVNMTAETKEFDGLVKSLKDKVYALGGYLEESSESSSSSYYSNYNRYASMTIRIPKDRADELIGIVEQDANILSRNESMEDVTLKYVDLESHKSALTTEEGRLLELLKQAENIEELIYIEDRLSDIRYQIESMESQLRTYDNKVDYTTIYLSINEVKELTPVVEENFGTRVKRGFLDSVESVVESIVSIVEWFLVHIPQLIFLGAWIFVIVKVLGIFRKRIAIKRAKKNVSEKETTIKKSGLIKNLLQKVPGGKKDAAKQIPVETSADDQAPGDETITVKTSVEEHLPETNDEQ